MFTLITLIVMLKSVLFNKIYIEEIVLVLGIFTKMYHVFIVFKTRQKLVEAKHQCPKTHASGFILNHFIHPMKFLPSQKKIQTGSCDFFKFMEMFTQSTKNSLRYNLTFSFTYKITGYWLRYFCLHKNAVRGMAWRVISYGVFCS